MLRRCLPHGFVALCLWLAMSSAWAGIVDTIARVKPAIVVVGIHDRAASPQFELRGTGFVVGDGRLVATNAHVVPGLLDPAGAATLAIQARNAGGEVQLRRATLALLDKDHDLALLRIEGTALPTLSLRDSDTVREGMSVAFTGFPIGGVLGFAPVTHRGMISAITAIVLPTASAQQLNEKAIRRMRGGGFHIFQLDATAYPGNSGSPVFDVDTGEVVGIINMVFVKSVKEAVLSHPSGISYAIPANFLQELLRSAQ